jgi:DNA primase
MNVTDDIKSRIDIVDLVSETVKLRRTGKNYTGFCPFHANTRTPAFVVFPDTGTWRCFGECNEGGDIFKFVMKKEGWNFSEALKALAKRAGVKLESLTPERKEENEQVERLRQLLEEAVIYYHSSLLQSTPGKQAFQYLIEKRGLQTQSIEIFGIGFAPEGWDTSMNHFLAKGYSTNDLLQAGLIVEKVEGGYHDRFHSRILFPVRDATGRMAGFGARILNPNELPKFINSPQTILFDKSNLLYGLDLARKAIRAADQAVIVEGYLDVVLLHQAGFKNTISPMGTALTEMQMRQIKHFTRRIIMALDPDAAGIKATLRGLEVAREALDHSDDPVFDARGLIHHETRLQADLRVSTLPQGMDPDDIVRKDPEQWKVILTAAKPIISHVLHTITSGRDLDDPKTKSQIAGQIMPLIRDVPNPVERDAYRQQLARVLQVDERSLIALANPSKSSKSFRKRNNISEGNESDILAISTLQDKTRSMEKHCLRLIIRHLEITYQLDHFLQSKELEYISENDFENAENQQIAHLIFQSLAQDQQEPSDFIFSNTPPDLDELMQELIAPIKEGEPESDKLIEDLERTLLLLRYSRITLTIGHLRFLLEEAQQETAVEKITLQDQLMEQIKIRGQLDHALARSK